MANDSERDVRYRPAKPTEHGHVHRHDHAHPHEHTHAHEHRHGDIVHSHPHAHAHECMLTSTVTPIRVRPLACLPRTFRSSTHTHDVPQKEHAHSDLSDAKQRDTATRPSTR